MPLITRRTLVAGMASSALAARAFGQQGADAYPDRTIKIICASPPGGGTDASSRGVGRQMQKLWNQPVVIENRAGGSNNIAAEAISKADPDGYTLLATTGNVMLVNAALFKHLNYDPAALEPVAILGNALTVLVTRKDFPAKTVPDLIAYAKANPGKVNFGHTGSGTSVHLAMELLQIRAGIKLVPVPYRGMAPAYNDLAGGHLDIMFVDLGGSLALHQNGDLRNHRDLGGAPAQGSARSADARRKRPARCPDFDLLGDHGPAQDAGRDPRQAQQDHPRHPGQRRVSGAARRSQGRSREVRHARDG